MRSIHLSSVGYHYCWIKYLTVVFLLDFHLTNCNSYFIMSTYERVSNKLWGIKKHITVDHRIWKVLDNERLISLLHS